MKNEKEQNATEEDMIDALEKGYIKDWRIKYPIKDLKTQMSIGIEQLFHQIGT